MLSLVHLIDMAGDKCMRQNACYCIYFCVIVPFPLTAIVQLINFTTS